MELILDLGWKLSAYSFLAMYTLWIFYLAVMSLQRARDAGTIPKPAYYLGLPILYLGLLLDCLVNVFICTIMMLEFPKEYLVTKRMSRHKNGPDGWRKSIATWIGDNLLDKFDPSGKHLK